MSEETSGAASSTIGIADYVGMLALLGWVHRDEDGQGAEEALRGATKGRLGGASELDGELQMLNEKCLTCVIKCCLSFLHPSPPQSLA
jgi:hypothetical protein